jgi:glycosyltransferase involved in cell wall biosynthesis
MKRLRIAQVAPLWENIPPQKYGGTERMVSYLTEGLVKKGHQVTLYAAGTANTSARLISVYPRPLTKDNIPWSNITYPLLNITKALDQSREYDIIHIHLNKVSDYLALPLAEPFKNKIVVTPHFVYPALKGLIDRHLVLERYKDLNYVSISNSQRKGGGNLNWIATVYNGIDIDTYSFNSTPEDYFFWLGKFNPDKGVREAIIASKKAKVKLVVAGTIDKLEKEDFLYYRNEVKPLINNKDVIYVGELNDRKKNKYYGNARGFLNPIQWNEPFGMVMIESMATGTPVISFNNGAAPEIITDKKTGYLVKDVDGMAKAIGMIDKINRVDCRQKVEKFFSANRMVSRYENVYATVLNKEDMV